MTSKNGLIVTKYSRPEVNRHLISRHRLHHKLSNALTCRLTLVVAPAGYGKTTAALDWLGKCGMPSVWLSVDAFDNNPVLFWRYFCTVLDGIAEGISKSTEYVLSSMELLKANIHINIMVDRLSEVESDFLIVLDDLHSITDSFVLGGLSYLIDYLPSKMHLVIISRTDPALGLAKYRIKWQIQRLNEKDLRFNNEEIFRFYQAKGFILGNDDIIKVESYTEGWAAALVAVAMSMENEKSSHGVISALACSSQDIEEYLKDEVISSWEPKKLSFAMKTCILDTLSESLCEAVTGDHNARQMLKEISEANGFLTALDDQKTEYRYHHLFSSFLRSRLSDAAPEEIAELHVRAARWFQERGYIPEAIEHKLTGGVYQEALEMIEHHTDYLIHQNDFGTLMSWMERLPKDMLDNSFQAAFIYTTYYAAAGRYDLARQWLARAKELAAGQRYVSDPKLSKHIYTECTLVEASLLIREGNSEFMHLILSAATRNDGDFVMPKYFDFNTGDICYYRCPFSKLIESYGEDPEQYEKVIGKYRELISVNPGYKPLISGEYLYENNRLEEALPYLLSAMDEAQAASCAGALVPAMVYWARIKRAKGDILGALDVLCECEDKLQGIGKPHWNYLINAFRCRLNIDSGAAEEVEEWFASRRFNIYSEISGINEFELLVYSRALIVKGRRDDAELLLKRLLVFTKGAGRLHSMVEVLNLLAFLAGQNNDMRRAMNYLGNSLTIGREKGYFRSFMDEFSPMVSLLSYYITRRKERPSFRDDGELTAYAKKVLLHMKENPVPCPKNHDEEAVDGISKLLTPQEKKVLELLAKANTNAEIGFKLGIGIRTVKTHVGNIYSKLEVKNRSQCMKLVREINLL